MAAEIDGSRRSRIAFAALAAAVVGPVAYVVQRLVDYASAGPPDLLAMLSMTSVAYYWRCAVAVVWAGMAASVALFAANRTAFERAATPLATAALVTAVVVACLAWLFP